MRLPTAEVDLGFGCLSEAARICVLRRLLSLGMKPPVPPVLSPAAGPPFSGGVIPTPWTCRAGAVFPDRTVYTASTALTAPGTLSIGPSHASVCLQPWWITQLCSSLKRHLSPLTPGVSPGFLLTTSLGSYPLSSITS